MLWSKNKNMQYKSKGTCYKWFLVFGLLCRYTAGDSSGGTSWNKLRNARWNHFWFQISFKDTKSLRPREGVMLCFIDPRVRKIRDEASSCPGIFSELSSFTISLAPPVQVVYIKFARLSKTTNPVPVSHDLSFLSSFIRGWCGVWGVVWTEHAISHRMQEDQHHVYEAAFLKVGQREMLLVAHFSQQLNVCCDKLSFSHPTWALVPSAC